MRISAWTALALLATLATAAAEGEATQEERAACRPDVRKLCADVRKGDNEAFRQCLQTHFQDLSPKCQQVLMNHKN